MDKDVADIKQPIYKRWWFGLIFIVTLSSLVFAFFAYRGIRHNQELGDKRSIKDQLFNSGDIWPDQTAKYIVASPVDLEQIKSISKYRSCAGHIRDGYSFERIREYDRSMKHYFFPVEEFQGTLDKVKVYSPVDGEIVHIDYEKDKIIPERPHNGGGIHISPDMDKRVKVVLGHIYTVKDYKVGNRVKAGELIGYASLGNAGNDFDVDLSSVQKADGDVEILGSIFDHMIEPVLAQFAKYGITEDNTKFTKEYADANPCNYDHPELNYNKDKSGNKIDPKLQDKTDGHTDIDHVQLLH